MGRAWPPAPHRRRPCNSAKKYDYLCGGVWARNSTGQNHVAARLPRMVCILCRHGEYLTLADCLSEAATVVLRKQHVFKFDDVLLVGPKFSPNWIVFFVSDHAFSFWNTAKFDVGNLKLTHCFEIWIVVHFCQAEIFWYSFSTRKDEKLPDTCNCRPDYLCAHRSDFSCLFSWEFSALLAEVKIFFDCMESFSPRWKSV